MSCYKAECRQYGACGWYQDYDYVIFANTEAEALGLALDAQPDTSAADWELEELKPEGAHFISSGSN